MLHILDGTPLGNLYRQGKIKLLDQDDYVTLVVDFLERLHPETFIHRLTGDGPRNLLLAPLWSLNKWEVLNAIDAELERRGTRQGDRKGTYRVGGGGVQPSSLRSWRMVLHMVGHLGNLPINRSIFPLFQSPLVIIAQN